MLQVHSGEILTYPNSYVNQFMASDELTNLVNAVVGSVVKQRVGICPCANRRTYSLYNADFGCKLNFYEGTERGIGWHYDKETSWNGPTFVVIFTLMLRQETENDVGNRTNSETPPVYEIFENGKTKQFVIAENSLHIHDTRNVYHRAFVPRGYKRSALVMHFSTAPCTPSDHVKGLSRRLVFLNILGRMQLLQYYMHMIIEKVGFNRHLLFSILVLYLFASLVIR